MTSNDRKDDDLDAAAFAALGREIDPPPALEERTVAALRAEGLLRRPAGGLLLRSALRSATAAALLLAGLALGRWSANPAPEQPGYVLLLRAAPGSMQPASEDEMMRQVEEYAAWARRARREGLLLTGEKLTDDGTVLLPEAGAQRRPFGDEGELEGYFLLRSMSREEAARVAAGCPHLRYGGTIELREIHHFKS